MSINTDGQKRQGKFLKKGSKILKAVHMTDFYFAQIQTEGNLEFDNADRSIIHAKFHDPAHLAREVKEPKSMTDRLSDPSHPQLAVIQPQDFTQDWHNQRINSKRRAMGFDDDDDYDFPTVTGKRDGDLKGGAAPAKPQPVAQPVQSPNVAPKEHKEAIAAHPADLKSILAPEGGPGIDANEMVKKARIVSIVEDPYHDQHQDQTQEPLSVADAKTQAANQKTQDEFIPLETGSPMASEDQAIATYKLRAELEKQQAALLEEMRSEAKADGYKDGFRTGEEKGVVAGQAAAGEIFQRVSELLIEFEGLKKNVLENIQKNFFELSQALAESLLEREFSIRPESFSKVLEKVIAETVTDNEFKIRLHPETWQKVIDLKIPSLEGHLIKDPAIVKGEFKVESNLTVVDGNIKKIVSQMLQNVDMNLFEETKAAS